MDSSCNGGEAVESKLRHYALSKGNTVNGQDVTVLNLRFHCIYRRIAFECRSPLLQDFKVR